MEEEALLGSSTELGLGINAQAAVTAAIWVGVAYIGYKIFTNFAKTH
tara:strand:- start:558 stop:698 length:141 start_codon:yes stop_codon:yes gene_type:complete